MSDTSIVIAAARRTPIGSFQGALSAVPTPELGAAAARAALADAGLEPGEISEVIMGCVLPAGLGQAPARQAALAAGLPESVGCTTINKVCGSGMKAAMFAHDLLHAGSARIVLAGGMESMSNAPYLLPKARAGYRMGHQQVLDHMFYDGLQNPYDGHMMGHFAEQTAGKYGFTREAQDAFSIESVRRALAAGDGAFATEITPVTVKTRRGEEVVATDEEPGRCDIDKIPSMRPAFAKDGTVTAASSSSISDGAAALVLTTAAEAERRGMTPLARIVGHAGYAHAPEWFTTAPVSAMHHLLDRIGWTADQVDLYEINEAFAVVAMAAIHDLGLDPAKVNVNGGACALGHPIGATGARILVTLVHALRARGLKRGVASLCIGGGEATAVAVEAL
ncbi:acetyl-CoA C-acyltransferase [Thioalkalivibrio sp. XN279]|uniref:acetyl-CoA C-acyltransferase n=1 Tax=Thioalkalivibrio sp. XN279 TaxID=2714953 RepID=UPI00140B7622|nr:acetyl-CoA C-acyltransferase [Thioalkalivibrio sp. XN279]NHA15859.1 acetyl-CoA C-acyltransferase [Thioalkalivibrio sp. XN279]